MSKQKRQKTIRFLCYALSILLVTYVLSIGPVFMVLIRSVSDIQHAPSAKLVESFYAPLLWCVENNHACGFLFVLYLTLWRQLFDLF